MASPACEALHYPTYQVRYISVISPYSLVNLLPINWLLNIHRDTIISITIDRVTMISISVCSIPLYPSYIAIIFHWIQIFIGWITDNPYIHPWTVHYCYPLALSVIPYLLLTIAGLFTLSSVLLWKELQQDLCPGRQAAKWNDGPRYIGVTIGIRWWVCNH